MTPYSSQDNIKAARELRDKLRLEEQDLRASIEYEQDTSKYDVDDADYRFLGVLNDLLQKLNQYLRGYGDDELPEAL